MALLEDVDQPDATAVDALRTRPKLEPQTPAALRKELNEADDGATAEEFRLAPFPNRSFWVFQVGVVVFHGWFCHKVS